MYKYDYSEFYFTFYGTFLNPESYLDLPPKGFVSSKTPIDEAGKDVRGTFKT